MFHEVVNSLGFQAIQNLLGDLRDPFFPKVSCDDEFHH
jgi:hypothetical protein